MNSEQFTATLPEFMRDFHDQKDLFKAIHQLYSSNPDNPPIPGNWVDNHVFVMDYFLWFMAKRGYTLQKYRGKKFETVDIYETIREQNEIRHSTPIIFPTKP
jgi:hypothetical protein